MSANATVASDKMLQRLAMVAVFGPLAIVIVGSRWLSQISVGPVFLYDVVLAGAFIVGGLGLFFGRDVLTRRVIQVSLVLLLLPALGVIHFAFSGVSEASLREFAPYLYMSFAWLVMVLFSQLTASQRKVGFDVIGVALGLHWLWVSAIKYVPGFGPIETPTVTFFDIRPDIDSTLVGGFAGYLLLIGIRPNTSWPKRLLLVIGAVVIGLEAADFGTRAGHLAAVAILAGAVIFAAASTVFRGRRKVAVSTTVSVTVAVFFLPLFLTGLDRQYVGALNVVIAGVAPGAPLIEISGEDSAAKPSNGELSQQSSPSSAEKRGPEFDVVDDPSAVQEIQKPASVASENSPETDGASVAGAQVVISGTARARWNAWTNLVEWMSAGAQRAIVGVGFGSDYMRESETLEKFLGPLDRVTQEHVGPHNILLFVFATTGILGLAVLGVVFFVAVRGAGKGFKTASAELYGLSFSLALGILTAASFGQVFEAPHGAIPLAWCVGVLVSGYVATSRVGEEHQDGVNATSPSP